MHLLADHGTKFTRGEIYIKSCGLFPLFDCNVSPIFPPFFVSQALRRYKWMLTSQKQDDPLWGTFVTTAFDARLCTYNIHRLLVVDTIKVYTAAAAQPNWDKIILIVNDPTYGDSGGEISVISTHTFAAQIGQQEEADAAPVYRLPSSGEGPGYLSIHRIIIGKNKFIGGSVGV
jgi:hypothetical protein